MAQNRDQTEEPAIFAVGDLHINHQANRQLVRALEPCPSGWLLVVGDVAERLADIAWALEHLRGRFAKVIWVPGNHELWTLPGESGQLRGEPRYERLVELCRSLDVLTPEDPYPTWTIGDEELIVVPLFTLYDYSFRRAGVSKATALEEATRHHSVCADEFLLHPDPHPTREAWCHARIGATLERLEALPLTHRTLLVSHWPLRLDRAHTPRLPHFELWCGTRKTETWHRRFRAAVVVTGHTHMPSTSWSDGVRFEEVSLGYPRERGRSLRRPLLRRVFPTATS